MIMQLFATMILVAVIGKILFSNIVWHVFFLHKRGIVAMPADSGLPHSIKAPFLRALRRISKDPSHFSANPDRSKASDSLPRCSWLISRASTIAMLDLWIAAGQVENGRGLGTQKAAATSGKCNSFSKRGMYCETSIQPLTIQQTIVGCCVDHHFQGFVTSSMF